MPPDLSFSALLLDVQHEGALLIDHVADASLDREGALHLLRRPMADESLVPSAADLLLLLGVGPVAPLAGGALERADHTPQVLLPAPLLLGLPLHVLLPPGEVALRGADVVPIE